MLLLIDGDTDVYYLNGGDERLYNSYNITIAMPEGTIDLQNKIMDVLNSLVVPKQESGIKASMIRDFEKIADLPSMARKDVEKDIHELLRLTGDLNKLSANTDAIKADMGDMLCYR
ncbi:MAG: hypothetical protein IME96_01320 [Proteobacteria bacterium]|nr:hypothetical protein [Pseudomonadota bacterium]